MSEGEGKREEGRSPQGGGGSALKFKIRGKK